MHKIKVIRILFLLVFPVIFFIVSPGKAQSFSASWTSTTVFPNIEGDTGTYTLTAKVPNAAGTGNSTINAGTQVEVQFQISCVDARTFTGGTFQGIPITTTMLTNGWVDFNAPVTVPEDSSFTIVLHGIANPTAGTYTSAFTGIKVWVQNNAGGMNTFQSPNFTIIPHTPLSTPSQGNNRVPNASFENFTTCLSSGALNLASVSNCPPWYPPTNNGSSDCFNSCGGCSFSCNTPVNSMGYQWPRSGNGYGGFYITGTNSGTIPYREYIQTKLTCPLIIGQTYDIKMYVSLAEWSSKMGDGFGILFSNDSATSPGIGNIIQRTPQISNPTGNVISDTSGWTLIGGTFVADSSYTYITIGNFKDNANTTIVSRSGQISEAYYYIDDISVTSLSSLPILINACNGNSTTLTAPASTSYLWNTGETSSFININPTTDTTYWVIAGCSDTTFFAVTVTPAPIASISASTTTLCNGQSTTLTASGGSTYNWDNGQTSSSITVSPTTTTTYTVTVTGTICTDQDNVTVIVNPDPVATINDNTDIYITEGSSITLTASGGSIYNWDPSTGLSCSDCANPLASPLESTTYCVSVSDVNGCVDTACIRVFIDDSFTFYIPNAFTPNGDGINDEFYGKGDNISSFEMYIFDRWGNILFFSDDLNKHWDGRTSKGTEIVEPSVYVYAIKLKEKNGNFHKYIGSITLVK